MCVKSLANSTQLTYRLRNMVVLHPNHPHWHDYRPRSSGPALIHRRSSIESSHLSPDSSSLPTGRGGSYGEEFDIRMEGSIIERSRFSFEMARESSDRTRLLVVTSWKSSRILIRADSCI
jgi:hypothetical protein